jgi:hypothetical protein
MRRRQTSLPISHEKIADLEWISGIGNWTVDENDEHVIIFNGERHKCEYKYDYYGGGHYERRQVLYRRLRVAELANDQKLIREFCYNDA